MALDLNQLNSMCKENIEKLKPVKPTILLSSTKWSDAECVKLEEILKAKHAEHEATLMADIDHWNLSARRVYADALELINKAKISRNIDRMRGYVIDTIKWLDILPSRLSEFRHE